MSKESKNKKLKATIVATKGTTNQVDSSRTESGQFKKGENGCRGKSKHHDRQCFDYHKQGKFLENFAKTGHFTMSCKVAGVTATTVYQYMRTSDEFKAAVEEAREYSVELMESEARRRAVEGISRIIYYQGMPCGREQQYSDGLLMFLLKGNAPGKYKDRAEINSNVNMTVKSLADTISSMAGMNIESNVVDSESFINELED